MAAEIGTQTSGLSDTPLSKDLAKSPWAFEFFQAVALLQRLRPGSRPVGGFSKPAEEAVHFRVNTRMAFPASQIQALDLTDDTTTPEMTVNFMGLTGPSGVLPQSYSELILERARAKDTSLADFLDIFNNRLVALFYRSWQKSRFPATFAGAGSAGEQDRFTGYLMDLIGLGTGGLAGRQEIVDEALLHYASLVGMQARSATALEQIIGDFFNVPVSIEQFAGSWYTLDTATQCRMTGEDSPSVQIGAGAVVGDAIWDRQGRVQIRIGPLTLERYREFLPDGAAYEALRALTRFFSNDCLDFELKLVLEANEVPEIELDFGAKTPARLGWLSWAKVVPPPVGAADAGPAAQQAAPINRDETILTL